MLIIPKIKIIVARKIITISREKITQILITDPNIARIQVTRVGKYVEKLKKRPLILSLIKTIGHLQNVIC